jgi:hypothetical protein
MSSRSLSTRVTVFEGPAAAECDGPAAVADEEAAARDARAAAARETRWSGGRASSAGHFRWAAEATEDVAATEDGAVAAVAAFLAIVSAWVSFVLAIY